MVGKQKRLWNRNIMSDYVIYETKKQINQCLSLLQNVLGQDLLGVYMYGSSLVGGLQKYSDIDLFVVLGRATTLEQRTQLVTNLLQISGIYQKSLKLPIEMTLVVKSEVNPWHYPPHFDFQYGDWLRPEFEGGNINPWPTKEMPDLAVLITQVLLASKTLWGLEPHQLLCDIPYRDFMTAMVQGLNDLIAELNSDTRNVLLTYARIWRTVETDVICSKPAAADWVIDRLPKEYQPVIKRAKAICIGEESEYWDDLTTFIRPCTDFIVSKINEQISVLERSEPVNKIIKIADAPPIGYLFTEIA
jgi:predicted nucleotidyltransferase